MLKWSAMLSVAKLSPGQERYYERSVADGFDDYYAGRGESPGVWVGRGAGELGLEGLVREGELGRLVRGEHPQSGERLRRHYRARRITVERDGHTLLIGVQRPEKRNAFDLQMLEDLGAAYTQLAEDDASRVGVLFAHGDHFSAGLDLAVVGPAVAERGPGVLKGSSKYDPFGVWGEPVPKPVVMAVNERRSTVCPPKRNRESAAVSAPARSSRRLTRRRNSGRWNGFAR